MQDLLIILDYDHKTAAMAARKLRAQGIACHIVPGDTLARDVAEYDPFGLIFAGGRSADYPGDMDGGLLNMGLPILAVGNAAASMYHLLGGEVLAPLVIEEAATVTFLESPLTRQDKRSERLLHTVLPFDACANLQAIAKVTVDGREILLGFRHQSLPIYGFGFQLENNDMDGDSLLFKFASEIAGASDWWTETAFINRIKQQIVDLVPDGTAICALTGGLDSTVAATIAHQALGERLRCFMVDTGLLRLGEMEACLHYYREVEHLNVTLIDAKERFLSALKGKDKEDDKREAIRQTMVNVLKDTLALVDYKAIIRGVTLGEVMRGAGKNPLIPQENKVLICPLADLSKDEVRYVAEKLGMPPEMVRAQPFPGTGLALRIRGEVTPERLALLSECDDAFVRRIEEMGMTRKLHKYFATLHPIDENRSSITLRAVSLMEDADGNAMLVPARLPYDVLESLANDICRAYPQAFKVSYDITSSSVEDANWQ